MKVKANRKKQKKLGVKKTLMVLVFPFLILLIIAIILWNSQNNKPWEGVNKDNLIEILSKRTELPSSDPLSVFRVQDSDVLKKEDDFYKDADDGDWVVIYKEIAIIYDGRKDLIKNIARK